VPPSSALSWLLGRRSSADLLPPLPTEPVKVPLDIPGDDFFVSRKQVRCRAFRSLLCDALPALPPINTPPSPHLTLRHAWPLMLS
jgi:hypothetical protein